MRFYDANPSAAREAALIGEASFKADAGETVTLERQWRTAMWTSFDAQIRLDDTSLVAIERDRTNPSDQGSVSAVPGHVFDCGETFAMTATIAVDPGTGRRATGSSDAQGILIVEMTVTTVRAMSAAPPPCDYAR
jgi:hypothetical protein